MRVALSVAVAAASLVALDMKPACSNTCRMAVVGTHLEVAIAAEVAEVVFRRVAGVVAAVEEAVVESFVGPTGSADRDPVSLAASCPGLRMSAPSIAASKSS